jgi:hypothetical protein
MNPGTLDHNVQGRVLTTAQFPSIITPSAIPFKDGRICVNQVGPITNWVSGLPFGANGRLIITTQLNIPVANYLAGLGFTASGRLACDTTGEIHHYVRGIPVTEQGRVCIDPLIVE